MSRLLYVSPHSETRERIAQTRCIPAGLLSLHRETRKAALFRPTARPQARLTNESAGYLGDGMIDNGWGVSEVDLRALTNRRP